MRKGDRHSKSNNENGSTPKRGAKPGRRGRFAVESLEARILLTQDLLYRSTDATPLTLRATGNVLQVVPTTDPSTVLAARPIALIAGGVRVEGGGYDVSYTIDASLRPVPGGITIDGGAGRNSLTGSAFDATWTIDGNDSGNLLGPDFVRFANVENLVGAANNQDTFVFQPGGRLSGVADGGAGGFDTMVIHGGGFSTVTSVASGPDAGTIDLDATRIRYAGLEPILITGNPNVSIAGTAGDDQLVVETDPGDAGMLRVRSLTGTIESVSFAKAGLSSLKVVGGGGLDTISVQTDIMLGGGALDLQAETITVGAGYALTGAGSVSLAAVADDLTTASHADRRAEVHVLGNITTAGGLTIAARVENAITSTNSGDITNVTLAEGSASIAEVGGAAILDVGTLQLRATNNVAISSSVATRLGTTSITATNQAHAGIIGTARVKVGGTAISMAEPASAVIEAIDDTHISSTQSQPVGALFETNLSLLLASVNISRDTQAYVLSTSLAGKALDATGQARVHAENTGSVDSSITSKFIGSATNAATEDALAFVSGARVAAGGLAVEARSGTTYSALGMQAVNRVSGTPTTGGTRAYVAGGVIAAGAGGVALSALDATSVTAVAPEMIIAVDSDLGSPSTPVPISLETARNNLDRTTEAAIRAGSDVSVANGDLTLDAENRLQARASARSASLSALPSYQGGIQVGLGGLLATNSILGGVSAHVDSSIVATTGTGAIALDARDSSAIDARTELSEVSRSPNISRGATGVSGGVSIALNTIGWKLDDPASIASTAISSLLTTDTWSSPQPVKVEAYLLDSKATTAGDLTLSADSMARINATVSNTSETTATSIYGASGSASGGILASNLINTAARAYLDNIGARQTATVGGDLAVTARDDAGVFANSKIVSTSITTNDGGAKVFDALGNYVRPADFTTDSGTRNLAFGQTVRVADDYAEGGTPGHVYKFLGTTATGLNRNLAIQDYTDYGSWKEVLDTRLIPQGNNVTDSGSVAVGGLVVRNDVRSDVAAFLENVVAKVATGDLTIVAIENAEIFATADSAATASGGSAYGSGTVVAVNGTIATNLVLGGANAYVKDSTLAVEDLSLDAKTTARIDATTLSATTSGDTAVGVSLAFNTIGWQAQNVLCNAVDALLNTSIGTEQPALTQAYVFDSTIDAIGDAAVSAESEATIHAKVGNEATSSASALFGATGLSTSLVLASNLVSSAAHAFVKFSGESQGHIAASGRLAVSAEDASSIDAETRMVASSTTNNDAGAGLVNSFATALLADYGYTTNSGTQSLLPGDLVRIAPGYGNGAIGQVYRYNGPAGSVNLGTQTYPGNANWTFLTRTNILPSGLNVSDSDAEAVGVTVVRNDVRGEVLAYLDRVALTARGIGLTATEAASILSKAESVANASGGSSLGAGTVIAGNGAAATNAVLSKTRAYAQNSSLTTTLEDIQINARNEAQIDATLLVSTSSGDTGVGVALAFNSVGWQSQNLLFNSLDALIGRPETDSDYVSTQTITDLNPGDRVKGAGGTIYRYIGAKVAGTVNLASQTYTDATRWRVVNPVFGAEQPAEALAYIIDSSIHAAGDVTLNAVSSSKVNATVSNAASSAASALYGASGKSIGGILASNRVSGLSRAYLATPTAPVVVGGALAIHAEDNVGIYANTKVASSSITTNDGGAGLLGRAVSDATDADFRTDEGIVAITFGKQVRIADDYAAEDFGTDAGLTTIQAGQKVKLAEDYANAKFTSDSGARLIVTGDVVAVGPGYSPDRAAPGTSYRFIGKGSRGLRVDLGAENYNDTSRWLPVGGAAGSVYQYLGANDTFDLDSVDYSDPNTWKEIIGAPGDVYQYMGTPNGALDLNDQNFGDLGYWKLVPSTTLIPQGLNLSPSDSIAIGGAVVLNDARSTVAAYIDQVTVTTGSITIEAIESAVIRAEVDSTASSSGGDVFGGGKSLAVNAVIATNVVLSAADAFANASDLTTTGAGEIAVRAFNQSQIDATTNSASTSGANAAAFLLAFNTIGWRAQNVLFNTLDAILGDPEISSALGNEQPARVAAYLHDTRIRSGGGLTVESQNQALIHSRSRNDATSAPSAFFGAAGLSVSGVLTSNMVSSQAKAYIDYSLGYSSGGQANIEAGGSILVSALDDAGIDANSTLYGEVSPNNDAATGLLNKFAGTVKDEYQYTSKSGIRNLVFGDKVRVGDDYYTPNFTTDGNSQPEAIATGNLVKLSDDFAGSRGEVGGLYKFLGASGSIDIGIENYDDAARWEQLGGVYQFMGTGVLGKARNLGTEDYANFEHWKRLTPANLITDSFSFALLGEVGTRFQKEGLNGESESLYGLIDRNDVRSAVNAFIDRATIAAAGSLTISADEGARITASDDSSIVPWEGLGGLIVTNLVLSAANAYATNSALTTTGGGDVSVVGRNSSLIDSTATSKVESWDAKSVVVALNTIGWKPQNLFFAAIDALTGDPLISEAFHGEQPAQVNAYLIDTTVNASGDLSLTAEDEAQINATVGNENDSEASVDLLFSPNRASQKADYHKKTNPGGSKVEGYGASGVAGGGALASNKVNSAANAYVTFTSTRGNVAAEGAITVSARDDAGIVSDSKVIQDAITSNTATGAVDLVKNLLVPQDYKFTTASGLQVLQSGDRVRVGATYAPASGDGGAVYKYVGPETETPVDLGAEDYTSVRWHKLTGGADDLEDLYPGIGNLTDSDARAVGILVVLNDARSAVQAYVQNAAITASNNLAFDFLATNSPAELETGQRVKLATGDVYRYVGVETLNLPNLTNTAQRYGENPDWEKVDAVHVSAVESALIIARAEVNVEASGGSFYGSGDVLAVGGQAVTNLILSSANAFVVGSDLTTSNGGNATIDAANTSIIDATVLSSTKSGDAAYGITLAFNTIGWKSHNLLFNAIDAILGDPLVSSAFNGEQPAFTQAYMSDTSVNVAGDLTLKATSEAQLNATVSNAAESVASALYGANGKAIGGAVASNKVNAKARAYLDGMAGTVTVGGSLAIHAEDAAGIFSNSKIVSSSITTNDGGASILQETINDFLAADHLSSEGTRTLTFGDRVRLDDNFGASDYSSDDGESPLTVGSKVQVADGYADARLTTKSGRRLLVAGDKVKVADGYDGAKGQADAVYRYVGPRARLDLGTQDYTNATVWKLVAGESGVVYRYLGGAATLDLATQDYTNAALWKTVAGKAGSIYEYLGTTRAVDLAAEDYGDLGFWKEVLATQLVPQGYNVSQGGNSDAMGLGGLIVVNDVRGGVEAFVNGSTIRAGDLTIEALETATIRADADSAAVASGGSAFGEGKVIAVNGTIATNLILSSADAYATASDLTTSSGDVILDAQNISQIDATTKSSTTSGDTGVGITLAFNSLGWRPQNVLFNTVDALIGEPVIAGAFGNDKVPAEVKAYLLDTTVDAAGAVNLSATSEAQVDAAVSNNATSTAVALKDASSLAVGGILASNLVNSTAQAFIDYSAGFAHAQPNDVSAGAGIEIHAQDEAGITSDSNLEVLASTTNDFGIGVLAKLALALLNDYQFTTKSGVQDILSGDMVRVSEDYPTATGKPGKTYRFVGTDLQGKALNLGTANFENASLWVELSTDNPLDILPANFTNVSSSDAIAVGGLVVRNDVRSDVAAFIRNAKVAAVGDIALTALESATILATDLSVVKSEGGSVFGENGNSVAVNGLIATNVVLSAANSFVTGSDLTTTNGGDLDLVADNTSSIIADITSKTTSNGVSVGATLAFNTIGWDSQNILFNTVDALFGTDIGTETPAQVRAYLEETDVHAAGAISLSATSNATIDASVGNSATAIVANVGSDTNGISVAAVLAMNKLSTEVRASINSAAVIQAAGDINVQAIDGSAIDASVNAPSLSVAISGESSVSIGVGLSLARNQIHNNMLAYLSDVAQATATGGNVNISSTEAASIDVNSTASAISVAVGGTKGTAFGGGGATAVNLIGGTSNAYVERSQVAATGGFGLGSIAVESLYASRITADVAALSVAVAAGGSGFSPAVAIGFSLARNLIGWTEYGGSDPLESMAYAADAKLTASRGIDIGSSSTASIDATVRATAVAVALSGGTGGGLSAGGLWTDNKVAVASKAYVDGSSGITSGQDIRVAATDNATIHADARAIAVSASLSGGNGGALAIGLSLAHNTIANEVAAYIQGATSVATGGSNLVLSASEQADISAKSIAAAVAVGLSGGSFGFAVAGGGAESTNVILTRTSAYAQDSNLGSTGNKVGNVVVTAASTASINALVGAVAASVAFGSEAGVGAAVGVAVARNFVGWDPSGSTAADYLTTDHPATLANGKTVKIASGARAGDVYRYLGSTLIDTPQNPLDLSTLDYSDRTVWKPIGLSRASAPVQAFLMNTSVEAAGGVNLSATGSETIDAEVLAGAMAIAGGGTAGVSLSGAGVYVENKVAADVLAYIDGDGATGVNASSVTVSALDTSIITATAGAASLAGSVGGTAGVSASIGLAVAYNEISNVVDASIRNADQGVTATGNVSVAASEDATIHADAGAASAAVALGGTAGVALSGAGALAFNVILTKVHAHIDAGLVRALGNLDITATDASSIEAKILAASGAIAVGGRRAWGRRSGHRSPRLHRLDARRREDPGRGARLRREREPPRRRHPHADRHGERGDRRPNPLRLGGRRGRRLCRRRREWGGVERHENRSRPS